MEDLAIHILADDTAASLPSHMTDLILDHIGCEVRPGGIGVVLDEQRVAEALTISDRAYVLAQDRVVLNERAAGLSAAALADIFLP